MSRHYIAWPRYRHVIEDTRSRLLKGGSVRHARCHYTTEYRHTSYELLRRRQLRLRIKIPRLSQRVVVCVRVVPPSPIHNNAITAISHHTIPSRYHQRQYATQMSREGKIYGLIRRYDRSLLPPRRLSRHRLLRYDNTTTQYTRYYRDTSHDTVCARGARQYCYRRARSVLGQYECRQPHIAAYTPLRHTVTAIAAANSHAENTLSHSQVCGIDVSRRHRQSPPRHYAIHKSVYWLRRHTIHTHTPGHIRHIRRRHISPTAANTAIIGYAIDTPRRWPRYY